MVIGRSVGRRGDGQARVQSAKFEDRRDAGRQLVGQLAAYRSEPDLLVLGLPRGGVPVAAEVAAALDAELDVVVVRKLGVPAQPELAMGAIAAAGDRIELVRNEQVLAQLSRHHSADAFDDVVAVEREELRRRERAYRDGKGTLHVQGRTVLLVDDGVATGATMRAAAAAVATLRPARLAAAIPVGSAETCAELRASVDEVICLWTPEGFSSVGQAYRNFGQTSDAEVQQVLG